MTNWNLVRATIIDKVVNTLGVCETEKVEVDFTLLIKEIELEFGVQEKTAIRYIGLAKMKHENALKQLSRSS